MKISRKRNDIMTPPHPFQHLQIERVVIDSKEGFLCTIDGEKSAVPDKNALLKKIKGALSIKEPEPVKPRETEEPKLLVGGIPIALKDLPKSLLNHYHSEVAKVKLTKKDGIVNEPCPICGSRVAFAIPANNYIEKSKPPDNRGSLEKLQPWMCGHGATTNSSDHPAEIPLPCHKCGSDNTVKFGTRKTNLGIKQIRTCKDCGAHYTNQTGYGIQKKFSKEMHDEAMRLIEKMSYRDIADHLKKKYSMKISYATIGYWRKKVAHTPA
jgi:transposase-like protein